MVGQPVGRISVGTVTAALWENEISVNGQKKVVLKASLAKRYKDKDGSWKSTTSFGRNEIPLAMYCLQKAFDKMVGEEGGDSAHGGSEEEAVM